MSANKRLKEFFEYKKLKQREIAVELGYTTQYISLLLNSDNDSGLNVLPKIAKKYTELNMEWVLTGEGEMLKKQEPKSYNKMDEILQRLAKVEEDLSEYKNNSKNVNQKKVKETTKKN